MPSFNDRRSEERINHKARYLKIKSAENVPELANKELLGSTINISASGLQIVLDRAIPLHSNIEVLVVLNNEDTQYSLSGELRWCTEIEKNQYHVGILLKHRDNEETDYKIWRDFFKFKQ